MNKKQDSKLKKLLTVGLIVLGVTFASDVIGTFATYPTAVHAETGRQIDTYSSQIFNNEVPSETEMNRYDKLMRTPEAQYTMIAAGVTGLLSFVLYIYLVFFTYGRIRRKRLAADAEKTTVFMIVGTTVVATVLHTLFTYLYPGINSYSFGPNLWFTIAGMVTSFIIVAVITLFITMVAGRRYNKKHSFIVE